MTRDEIVALLGATADHFRIPRLLLLACCVAESGLNPLARRPTTASQDQAYWPDVSGGLAQQTVRWDPAYLGSSGYPGAAEVARVLAIQCDPERSAIVAATNLKGKFFSDEDDAIFKALCRYNLPGGHGQPANAGVAANYRQGIAVARQILGSTPMPTVVFDPAYPSVLQDDPASCAPTSLTWAMRSLGRMPADNWIEGDMAALGLWNMDVGLKDHTGSGIVHWLQINDAAHYGPDGYGISNSQCPITWASLTPELGDATSWHPPYPCLIGLPNWGGPGQGHWVGVRGFRDGRILLANPATGPIFGQDSLSQAEFEARAGGNASLVRIIHPDLIASHPAPPPIPIPPTPPPLTAWKAEGVALLDADDRAFRETLRAWLDRMPV